MQLCVVSIFELICSRRRVNKYRTVRHGCLFRFRRFICVHSLVEYQCGHMLITQCPNVQWGGYVQVRHLCVVPSYLFVAASVASMLATMNTSSSGYVDFAPPSTGVVLT